jgi:arylsulfatase A-like enzyme
VKGILLFIFLLYLHFFALPLHAQQKKSASGKPNILFILADDLGFADLSGYGAKDIRTPHIDALIQAGMKFQNFYANSPVCSPTRASILTGRYPDMAGVPGVIRTNPDDSWGYLSPKATLLPQLLKKAGYHTALIGKWHLGLQEPNTPNSRGFDHFQGFLGDMMDDYYTHLRDGKNFMRLNNQAINPEGHATDLFSQWAADYLMSRKNKKEPFFLYLAYNAPHVPVQPPAAWLTKVQQREKGISEKRAKLAALIEHMDAGIGQVTEALKANGQYENTLIVFTSDNGGELFAGADCGPWRGNKQDLYEGGIRVPMCAVWPGKITAGSQSDFVALTMDLFPTFCKAAGIEIPQATDGIPLWPLLAAQNQPASERDLFWMRREGTLHYNGQDYYAVRRGNWKLVQNHPFRPLELYNLAEDPLEKQDLAGTERKVYEALSKTLRRHIIRSGAVPWQKPQ